MERIYLSGGMVSWLDVVTLGNMLRRSDVYFSGMGMRVWNPYELFGVGMCVFMRWLCGLYYLLKSDMVVFPSWWRLSVWSRLDMLFCRLFFKDVIIKEFD